jgi:hypothetical protein
LTNVTLPSAGTVTLPALGCDLQTSMFSTLPPLNSTVGGPAGAADAGPAISAGPVPRAATTRILGKRADRKLPDRKRVFMTIQRFGGEQCTAGAAHEAVPGQSGQRWQRLCGDAQLDAQTVGPSS